MAAGIYRIINAVANKSYVGGTKTLERRWGQHRYKLNKGTHNNPHLLGAWRRDGEAAWVYLVLEECAPEILLEREAYWIAFYETQNPAKGYNICHPDRHTVSEETRARIAKGMKGRKATLEARANMAAAQKARVLAPEVWARVRAAKAATPPSEKWRAAHRGWKVSDEARAKQSQRQKGRKPTAATVAKIVATRKDRSNYAHSEAAKGKMSAARKGKKFGPPSEATRSKISAAQQGKATGRTPWNKGIPCSAETKAKVSAAVKKHAASVSHWNEGRKYSEAERDLFALRARAAAAARPVHWNKDRKHWDETKAKISATKKARNAEKRILLVKDSCPSS